jgi:hypothetical protein
MSLFFVSFETGDEVEDVRIRGCIESSWSEFKYRSGERGDMKSLGRGSESRNRSTAKTMVSIALYFA